AHRGPEGFSKDDLILEMYRQHTLLYVMAARLRESAEVLQRSKRMDLKRIERLLDVHHRYLIETHLVNDRMVQDALAQLGRVELEAFLERCSKEQRKPEEFERQIRQLMKEGKPPAGPDALKMADLVRKEADRIEEDHGREDEVYRTLDTVLTPAARKDLLQRIRQVDAPRIGAEIALISWGSQIHASAD
ncbi:MAG: hypothetical protein WAN77_05950, partial [Thermoplasmata archaeon]